MFSNNKKRIRLFSSLFFVIVASMGVSWDVSCVNAQKLPCNISHLVLTATRRPLVINPDLSLVSFGQFEYILFDIISKNLQLTYEVRPPPDIVSPGYRLPNGTWTGAAGLLQRKEVDMFATTSSLSTAKFDIVDVSFPVTYADASFIVPFPRRQSKWVDTSAFHPQVWLVLGITFLFMILAAWTVNRITNTWSNQRQNSLIYWIFYFVSIWTSQGVQLRNSSSVFRVVVFSSTFGIYIISNYFTAAYTSILSIPTFKMTVNSIEDLANSVTVKTLVLKGSSIDEYLMSNASKLDSVLKKLSEQMELYPERRIINAFIVEDISTIIKEDTALIMGTVNAESMIQRSYNLHKECRVTLSEKSFYSSPQFYTFPKNSPLVESIDEQLLLMHQSGLIQYAMRSSTSISRKRCFVSEIKKGFVSGKPLGLDFVIGAFFILAVGFGLGFFTFIAELSVLRLKKIMQKVKQIKERKTANKRPNAIQVTKQEKVRDSNSISDNDGCSISGNDDGATVLRERVLSKVQSEDGSITVTPITDEINTVENNEC